MATSKTKGTSKKIKELTGVKPEKINEEQLARLQSSIKTVDKLTTDVGTIEVRKYALMKAMEQVQRRIEQLRVELKEEYGTDNINIQDGTITYSDTTSNPEENGEANKKN
tara:strand:- start:67 stop:396 length:330 start_codon:yes stop_codon:yes gene_type:complete